MTLTANKTSLLGTSSRRPSYDSVCVVIPAFNEALLIRRCIESVIAAGVPAAHIYVVDDASTDGTAAVVEQVPGINLLVNEPKRGKLGGIQNALQTYGLAERYEFFAVLDADSHVAPGYFTEVLARFLRDDGTVLVCGAPHSERYNWLTAYRAYEYAVTLKLYREGQDALGVITVAPGCASVYRTRIIGQLDWHSKTLVEDMDLTVQIHRRRLGKVAYTPHAVAYTQDPRTLKDYVGQLTRWYRGTWQVIKLRRVPFGRQRIDAELALLLAEGMFFSTVTLCLPVLALFWPTQVLQWLLLDTAAMVTFAVIAAAALRRGDILASLFAFPMLRAINSLILLRTFWLEIVCRKQTLEWFTVARYREA